VQCEQRTTRVGLQTVRHRGNCHIGGALAELVAKEREVIAAIRLGQKQKKKQRAYSKAVMGHLNPANPNVIIGLYVVPHTSMDVSAQHMARGIQRAAMWSMIWLEGYNMWCLGPHFLWASGAMPLKLNGVSDSMWLQFLHGQILRLLTHGLSAHMATPVL
jgi:hypothetical protein